jgi:hypothetical protein
MLNINYFTRIALIIILCNLSVTNLSAQITPNDGDWSEKYVILHNTPEAEYMVRTGDIDNLGFGWPINFDPFSGNSTPSHAYPWTPDTTDPGGTDRIMVITSYNGNPPHGQDGYTTYTSRPGNIVEPITLTYDTINVSIQSAILYLFVDDFQAPVWGASYEVYFDGVRVPFLESIINPLVQTGPIGKIIGVEIPPNYLYLLQDDTLSILIDDFTTGAGDGYAIDFAKLLLNPTTSSQTGIITGIVKDFNTSMPLADVLVVANGIVDDTTDASGNYTLNNVLAGLVSVQTFKPGYGSQIKTTSLIAGQTNTVNFDLNSPAPQIIEVSPSDSSMGVPLGLQVNVKFDMVMDTTTINSSTFIFSDIDSSLRGTFIKTDTTFTFVPEVNLKPDMDYWVTLTTGIQNSNSVSLESDYTWTFSTRIPFSIKSKGFLKSQGYSLYQNFPNPFNPSTTIEFSISKTEFVTLKIYNLLGQEVALLVSDKLNVGRYRYEWDAGSLANGIYLYRIQSGDFIEVKKMVLMK